MFISVMIVYYVLISSEIIDPKKISALEWYELDLKNVTLVKLG